MTGGSAIDNDVLIKLSAYSLPIAEPLLIPRPHTALQTAKYVVPHSLTRLGIDAGSFDQLFDDLIFIEPTESELRLASRMEDVAAERSLPVDSGESLIAAMVLEREMEVMVTGDKRAIVGLAKLSTDVPEIAALRGKTLCVEQLFQGIIACRAWDVVRETVCAHKDVDRALTIIFACHSVAPAEQDVRDGLLSYIHDLAGRVPGWLAASP